MRDGHIHSPYCPHGTKDTFRQYIERAMTLGYTEISFTEHAPLPRNFEDPTPMKDSSISLQILEKYLEEIENLKKEYLGQLKINKGLEVDYIEGYEEEITDFLNTYGPYLDDSILSVHFLLHKGKYDCLDYSPQVFAKMIRAYPSLDAVYERYFETVLKSVLANLGGYKPKRIGHMTLVHKFQKKFPIDRSFAGEITHLLQIIKEQGYALDYNGAGTAKPLCQEPYPPTWIALKAVELEIPLIYGSDAHQSKDLNQGRELLVFKTTT
jgi:histidinol-phosphatase (PHP family)